MKKLLIFLLIGFCVIVLIEAVISDGLIFFNPYGKVPRSWLDRGPVSTISAWIVTFIGLPFVFGRQKFKLIYASKSVSSVSIRKSK